MTDQPDNMPEHRPGRFVIKHKGRPERSGSSVVEQSPIDTELRGVIVRANNRYSGQLKDDADEQYQIDTKKLRGLIESRAHAAAVNPYTPAKTEDKKIIQRELEGRLVNQIVAAAKEADDEMKQELARSDSPVNYLLQQIAVRQYGEEDTRTPDRMIDDYVFYTAFKIAGNIDELRENDKKEKASRGEKPAKGRTRSSLSRLPSWKQTAATAAIGVAALGLKGDTNNYHADLQPNQTTGQVITPPKAHEVKPETYHNTSEANNSGLSEARPLTDADSPSSAGLPNLPSERTRPERRPGVLPSEVDPLAGKLRDPEYRLGGGENSLSLEEPIDFNMDADLLDRFIGARLRTNYKLSVEQNYRPDNWEDGAIDGFNNYQDNPNWTMVARTNVPNSNVMIVHSGYQYGLGIPGAGDALPGQVFESLWETRDTSRTQTFQIEMPDESGSMATVEKTDEYNGTVAGEFIQLRGGKEVRVRMVIAGAYRLPTNLFNSSAYVSRNPNTSFEFDMTTMGVGGGIDPEGNAIYLTTCSGDYLDTEGDHAFRNVFVLVPEDEYRAWQKQVGSELTINETDPGINFEEMQNTDVGKDALADQNSSSFMRAMVRLFYPNMPNIDEFINTYPVVTGEAVDANLDGIRHGSVGTNIPILRPDGSVDFVNMAFRSGHEISNDLFVEEFFQSLQYQALMDSKEFRHLLGGANGVEAAKIISQDMRAFLEIIQQKVKADHGIGGNAYHFYVNGELIGGGLQADSPEMVDMAYGALTDVVEIVMGRRYTSEELLNPKTLTEIEAKFSRMFPGHHLWNLFGIQRLYGTTNSDGSFTPDSERNLDQPNEFSINLGN